MYKAKNTGRNRVEIFPVELTENTPITADEVAIRKKLNINSKKEENQSPSIQVG